MRSRVEGTRLENNLMMGRNRLGVVTIPSTGSDIILDADMPPLISLALTAAANVKLPAASGEDGLSFTFLNPSSAAGLNGTLQTSTGGPIGSTGDIIRQNEVVHAYAKGGVWYADGHTT